MGEYFRRGGVCIYNESLLATRAILEDSVDLIITSPPYNVDVFYESYDDKIPYDAYLEFTRKWLEKCYKLVKDDGRFCLNIPLDKNKGGQQSVYADIVTLAKQIGWKYHSTIVWNEQNISRRTAWGSWLSASAPYVIAPVEMIVVLYKKRWKKVNKGVSNITKDEFIEWTNGVWNFMGESKKRIKHPSPFPVTLPRRCIKLFSYVNDLILDPFLGSGTTLIACVELNRRGIGVEIDPKYCEIARDRIEVVALEMCQSRLRLEDLPKLPGTRERVLCAEEIQKLLVASQRNKNLYDIILTAWNTGLRLSECLNLRWEDIDLGLSPHLTVTDGKGGKARRIPLNSVMIEMLRGRRPQDNTRLYVFAVSGDDRPYTLTGFGVIFVRVAKKAGIKCTFHDLRHSFATNLVLGGVDLATVRDLIGHNDSEATIRYTHPNPEAKGQVMEASVQYLADACQAPNEGVGTKDGSKRLGSKFNRVKQKTPKHAKNQ